MGGSRISFRRGCTRLLLYFNTNKPHSFFFAEYQLYKKTAGHLMRGGAAHPLHPPPRSAPGYFLSTTFDHAPVQYYTAIQYTPDFFLTSYTALRKPRALGKLNLPICTRLKLALAAHQITIILEVYNLLSKLNREKINPIKIFFRS